MCYTGKCKYENYEGECTLTHKQSDGITFYPEDAQCEIETKEMLLEYERDESRGTTEPQRGN